MDSKNIVLAVAVIAAVVAFSAFLASYGRYEKLTGYATSLSDTATINLSVESSAAINFTVDNINWGSGKVNLGLSNATLYTSYRNATNMTGGNFTGNTVGLMIENIGNMNVSLYLKFAKNSTTLLEGTHPKYQYNLTSNESNSCTVASNFALSTLYDANNSAGDGTYACANFTHFDNQDQLRLDIRLVVPSDSLTGALSDTITAGANPS